MFGLLIQKSLNRVTNRFGKITGVLKATCLIEVINYIKNVNGQVTSKLFAGSQ